MFCSDCGNKAAGKFCSHCGHRLNLEQTSAEPADVVAIDWRNSIDYLVVSQATEVQQALKRAEQVAQQSTSGATILQLADTVTSSLSGGVSGLTIAKIAQPIYAKLGMQTTKERRETLAIPPGQVLASILYTLAREGQKLLDVQQETDACTLVASMPIDLRALEGKQTITVCRAVVGTEVAAVAHVPGSWYDWGKCNRTLDVLFSSFWKAA